MFVRSLVLRSVSQAPQIQVMPHPLLRWGETLCLGAVSLHGNQKSAHSLQGITLLIDGLPDHPPWGLVAGDGTGVRVYTRSLVKSLWLV